MRRNALAGGDGLQPGGVLLKRREEILQPAILRAVFESAGPDPEFFHVIAKRGHAAGACLRAIAEIGDTLFHAAKRNQIPQLLQPREKPNRLSAILGDVRTE